MNTPITADQLDVEHPPDHYALLGVAHTASVRDIQRAYRVRALTCHPDKVGAADTRAAALFHALSVAMECLTNADNKRAYDVELQAERAKQEQLAQLGAKRRAGREDLEAREADAASSLAARHVTQQAAVLREAHIRALREQGIALVHKHTRASARHVTVLRGAGMAQAEAQSRLVNPAAAGMHPWTVEDLSCKVTSAGTQLFITSQHLNATLSRCCGPVDQVLMGGQNSAIVLFKGVESAVKCALAAKSGSRADMSDLHITWLSERQPDILALYHAAYPAVVDAGSKSASGGTRSTSVSVHKPPVGLDYEAHILERMRSMGKRGVAAASSA
jgi:hypothetical protein